MKQKIDYPLFYGVDEIERYHAVFRNYSIMCTYEKQLLIEFETKLDAIQYRMSLYQASATDAPKDIVAEWDRVLNIVSTLKKELNEKNQ